MAIILVTLRGERPIRVGKMRKVLYIFIGTAFFLFSCLSVSYSASAVKTVKRANRLYKDKKFDEALKDYNEAQAQLPDSDITNFNMGAALYKKGEYSKAIESFTKALTTEDSVLEAKTNYNIGNNKYKQGKLKQNTDLASAVDLYREALQYYKRAIELNEKDKDAKYNHEFVEKKLKILLDKLKKQEEKMKKGKKEEQGKEKKSQLQTASSGRKKEEGKKEAKGEKGEQRKKQVAEAKAGQEQPKEMSEQEARMLLEGYRQEEESKGKIKQRVRKGYYPKVLEDW
ncbi:MAG: tetratricopeptide repeat protein [bacterium]